MKTYYLVEIPGETKYIFQGKKVRNIDYYTGQVIYSFFPNRDKGQFISPPRKLLKKLSKTKVVTYKLLGYLNEENINV